MPLLRNCSLVPRPILFFTLRFSVTIIHEAEVQQKRGRPGSIHHMRSGHKEGGAQPQVSLNTVEWSDLQHVTSPLAVKCSNLADWMMNWSRIGYGTLSPPPPPTSTSCPPGVTHVMNAPRPSTLFCHTSASMYYRQWKPKSEKRVGLGTRLLWLWLWPVLF